MWTTYNNGLEYINHTQQWSKIEMMVNFDTKVTIAKASNR